MECHDLQQTITADISISSRWIGPVDTFGRFYRTFHLGMVKVNPLSDAQRAKMKRQSYSIEIL